jgi:magnesium chelatase family protein
MTEEAKEGLDLRISGPLLDRFDLHVEVPRVPPPDVVAGVMAESSQEIRARVRPIGAPRAHDRRSGRQGVDRAGASR